MISTVNQFPNKKTDRKYEVLRKGGNWRHSYQIYGHTRPKQKTKTFLNEPELDTRYQKETGFAVIPYEVGGLS